MHGDYRATIGLEIHAELKTLSKMFCGCKNAPDAALPNEHICPVCLAHPGTLPVINREAVRQVLRVGVAVGGELADFTEFDRKNYFYPDIPKNYQISQYKYPLVSGGSIGTVRITRIHLEEDTARSAHGVDTSNVDYNRAGVPLMELVTEPVMHDAETAVAFARELRLLLRYLGASDANLEKGEMRVEANVSIAREGEPLGTKVEVKNLNSFKAVEQAIAFEIKRQRQQLETGAKVLQETRGWDENRQKTFSQRVKEESHDYRYFPEPDLPKLFISELAECAESVLRDSLPTLPWDVRETYVAKGVNAKIASLLASQVELNALYTSVCALLPDTEQHTLALHYLTSDLLGVMSKSDYAGRSIEEHNAEEFAQLIQLIGSGTLSSRGAKDTLAVWAYEGGSPKAIAERLHVLQVSNAAELQPAIRAILKEHANIVAEYRAGKEAALQYLIGQGMKATKGAANPAMLKEILVQEIARVE